MRFYELPYFIRLLDSRFGLTLAMHKLTERNAEAAVSFTHKLVAYRFDDPTGQVLGQMNQFVRENRLRLAALMPATVWLVESGWFASQNLSRIRSYISECEIAEDHHEVVEYLAGVLNLEWCEGCEQYEFTGQFRSTYEGNYRCRDCIESDYVWSAYYDEYVFSDNAVSALDEYGSRCTVDRDDDDFEYNEEAGLYVHIRHEYSPPEPQVIGGYHESKRQVVKRYDDWTKTHNRFFGVELEVEINNHNVETQAKARALNALINGGQIGRNVFFERDGSLNNGFEIISHPMSLPAHRELWTWLRNREAVKDLLSHKTTTCGLHVHVSRDRLTRLQIAKMVAFVNNPGNAEFMTALARRYGQAATGYCRIKAEKAKVGNGAFSEDRYEAVNITPRATIEFRIFKGTLKYESLVAAIEFVNALVEYTATCGDCSVKDLSHEAFMQFAEQKLPKETATLRSYVTNRLETV